MEKSQTNFETACKSLNIGTALPDVTMIPETFRKTIVSFYKLIVIIKAKKAGRKLDWNNWNQSKFMPWFNMSGSGFVLRAVVRERGSTCVGSRLSSYSEQDAKEIATDNIDLYNDVMIESDDK